MNQHCYEIQWLHFHRSNEYIPKYFLKTAATKTSSLFNSINLGNPARFKFNHSFRLHRIRGGDLKQLRCVMNRSMLRLFVVASCKNIIRPQITFPTTNLLLQLIIFSTSNHLRDLPFIFEPLISTIYCYRDILI